MARYTYKIKDTSGKTVKGIVEAISIKQASQLLHERGFYIIDLHAASTGLFAGSIKSSKVSVSDLAHITRQLSTMVTAGLTLVESLSLLEQQLKKPHLNHLINDLEEGVRGGASFSSVLEKYPNIFPSIYLALIRAGEASGKLDVILTRLAENLEKSRDFQKKIIGSLTYPAIVIFGMIAVSVVVMTIVVPRLTALYQEFGIPLPLPTVILITMSNILLNFWWLLIAIGAAAFFGYTRWKKTYLARQIVSQIQISMPILGTLVKEATIVELTRTLSILLDGGVPILTALNISKDATGNVLFQEAFAYASQKVEKGFPLSVPLSERKIFPPILSQMVAVGERTGKLGESLLKLSRYFEAETDLAVKTLTTVIEPLIMVVLGVGVGFLVLAVLMPIYTLTSSF